MPSKTRRDQVLRCSMPLLAAGLLCEGIYLILTQRLPWWRHAARLHSWRQLLGGGRTSLGIMSVGIVLLMVAYLAGWAILRSAVRQPSGLPRQARWVVWCLAILFAFTLLWLLPISSDLFTYLSQAHLFTDLGANPLSQAVLESSAVREMQDPLLLAYLMPYSTTPSVYGPAWILLSSLGTVGRHDVAGGVSYLKTLAALAFLGCAWLLERILNQGDANGAHADKALEGLYLFAWNPLLLLMAVGDGHNDIVMMVFALLAFWFLRRESWTLALGALALSIWIKYVSVIFLPLFVLYIWRQKHLQERVGFSQGEKPGWALVIGLGAALLVTVLILAPFWPVTWASGLLQRLLMPANWRGDVAGWSRWALLGGLILFAVFYSALVRRFAMVHATWAVLVGTSFFVALCAFILGAARSQPWHLLWPAALAGLSPAKWAWPVTIGLSGLMLVTLIWIEWGMPGIGVFS